MSTDVQDFNMQIDGAMIRVTCILAKGSAAKGCVVQLLFDTLTVSRNIMRKDKDSSIASGSLPILVCMVYDEIEVHVFDYEHDGSVGSLYWSDVVKYANPVSTGEL